MNFSIPVDIPPQWYCCELCTVTVPTNGINFIIILENSTINEKEYKILFRDGSVDDNSHPEIYFKGTNKELKCSCPSNDINLSIIAPKSEYKATTSGNPKISSIALSSDGEYISWGDGDGTLFISNPKSINPPFVFKDHHFSSINTIHFYPSNKVILTGSSDFTLHISNLSARIARTLTGHRGGILSSGIIGIGKEVLSTGRDGLIKIWNCGTGQAVNTIDTSVIEGRGSGTTEEERQHQQPTCVNCNTIHSEEVFSVGCENGKCYSFDKRNSNTVSIFNKSFESSITSVCFNQHNSSLCITLENGEIVIYDIVGDKELYRLHTLHGYCTSSNLINNELLLSFSSGVSVQYNSEYKPYKVYSTSSYDSIVGSLAYCVSNSEFIYAANSCGSIFSY